ncbi:MAG: nitroreductase family protein [Elusimicrobiales bacterium]|nr:nitroreductase family protein [Elusimicrobiales bacterium]
MKTFLDLAARRRSIRKYLDRPVEPEKLDRCLEAARLAPSACNSQPCRYVAVTDPELKRKFCEAAFSGLYSATRFAAAAPVIVAVVADKGNLTVRVGNLVRGTSFYLVDTGISCAHFALAAQDEGLGTCIIGWFDAKKAGKILGVPFGKRVELLISLGYPAENPTPRPRKTFAEACSRNRY